MSKPEPAKDNGKMENTEIVTSAGTMVLVDNIRLPKSFESNRPLAEHVQCLQDLEMREDDVMILAYPKAGTHWLWEITSMLLAGKAEHEKRVKEMAMMEATAIEHIQAQPSPRVLNSHLPLRLLPRQIKEKKVKVIQVYRNVKDLFVSKYFHMKQMPGGEGMTWDLFEEEFFSETAPMGNFFNYMKEEYQFRKDNPDIPFFVVSFEDSKEHPGKVIRKLAQFLGVEASDQLCQDIAEATTLTKMREADKLKQKASHIPLINFYRKGQVGDWKNHMTVAQSERFDAAIKQLESCDYNFRFEL
ncbi:sulfotransferase 1A1-like [Babylonia areolata]|uniref:sulfotransferase 1A1-like n=1 Tax=Babylonia areolata TaxID=304850 RepID=UPI003FD471BF